MEERELASIDTGTITVHSDVLYQAELPCSGTDVMLVEVDEPELTVYEDDTLLATYRIDARKDDPPLRGRYLAVWMGILPNYAMQLQAAICKNEAGDPLDDVCERRVVRCEPVCFSRCTIPDNDLQGKGLFARGYHSAGRITPGRVIRWIARCDACNKSFTMEHFHAGMDGSQYFYSEDSSETVVISCYEFTECPGQLAETVSPEAIAAIEEKLPKPKNGSGAFRYYNPFRCPHCKAPYIDFERYPEIRPHEYYGYTYINEVPWMYSAASS